MTESVTDHATVEHRPVYARLYGNRVGSGKGGSAMRGWLKLTSESSDAGLLASVAAPLVFTSGFEAAHPAMVNKASSKSNFFMDVSMCGPLSDVRAARCNHRALSEKLIGTGRAASCCCSRHGSRQRPQGPP